MLNPVFITLSSPNPTTQQQSAQAYITHQNFTSINFNPYEYFDLDSKRSSQIQNEKTESPSTQVTSFNRDKEDVRLANFKNLYKYESEVRKEILNKYLWPVRKTSQHGHSKRHFMEWLIQENPMRAIFIYAMKTDLGSIHNILGELQKDITQGYDRTNIMSNRLKSLNYFSDHAILTPANLSLLLENYGQKNKQAWQKISEKIAEQLEQAKEETSSIVTFYLKSVLAFLNGEDPFLLTSNSDTQSTINPLDNLIDQLAYHCLYSPNETIVNFIKSQINSSKSQSNLSNLIFIGLRSTEAQKSRAIIQNYVDETGDFKTAAELAAFCGDFKFKRHERVQAWIAEYAAYLNYTKDYRARISFQKRVNLGSRAKGHGPNNTSSNDQSLNLPSEDRDTSVAGSSNVTGRAITSNEIIGQELCPSLRNNFRKYLSVYCSYCGKLSKQPNQILKEKGTSSLNHSEFCNNCRKQLPRCCVCNLNIGYSELPMHAVESGINVENEKSTSTDENEDKNEADLDCEYNLLDSCNIGNESSGDKKQDRKMEAITWCRGCKHIYHLSCSIKWFSDPAGYNCAVSACTCNCIELE